MRPGGRTARNTEAVLEATLTELGTRGYAGLTVERIATRSGVHKSTIYRRWGGVDGLLSTALARSGTGSWRPPQTGALHTDLLALLHRVTENFTSEREGPVATAAIAAAFESARAASALHDFFVDQHGRSAVVVEAAIARGEVPAGTDGREVVRSAVAPIYYRLFVSREPVTDADVELAARVATEASIAGLFCPVD
ncbi:TetR family transcriptional regulator [Nocardiopsis terrae]|nr:TetR family transcriptional regulator [Nocardiopsis terrae]